MRIPTPGEIWEHRRTARQVYVLTVPADARASNARVVVRGQRRSAILLHAFLRDYRPLDSAVPVLLFPGQRVWMVIEGLEDDGPQLVEVGSYDPEWRQWQVRAVEDDGSLSHYPYVAGPENVVPAPEVSA